MKTIGKILIVTFCLWHMFSISIFVVPDEVKNPVIRKVVDTSLIVVRPYMYSISQWQKWNIFSPNPLRRVSTYIFDVEENGIWREAFRINPMEVPWWKRSRELKLIRHVEEIGDDAVVEFLAYLCRSGQLPHGAHVRMRRSFYVIPTVEEVNRTGGWSTYEPKPEINEYKSIYCQ